MILEYIKKFLPLSFFLTTDENSTLGFIKEAMRRKSIFQLKNPSDNGLTSWLNFRPLRLEPKGLVLETTLQSFSDNMFEPGASLTFTIFMLPEPDKLPLVATCETVLLNIESNTRILVAIPNNIENKGLNKSGRVQLEPRHAPVISLWLLDKKCNNIRVLKMINPMLLYTPKRNDADRCLVDISKDGICLSLGSDIYRDQQIQLKSGKDVLMQLSFTGPDSPHKYDFLIIGSIRYIRPKRKSGRIEVGVHFFHIYHPTPKPTWVPCHNDGIEELDWLLQKFKKIYIADIKKKLTVLCDIHSLEALPAEGETPPKYLARELLAAKNELAADFVRNMLPSLAHIKLTLQYIGRKSTVLDNASLLKQALNQCFEMQIVMENLQEMGCPTAPNFSLVQTSQLINDLLESIDEILRSNDITWERIFQENIPDVQGDPRLLRLVFLNLFQNSMDAMQPSGGNLHITAVLDLPADCVAITVEDTGCGIPGDFRSHIFQPYHSADEKLHGLGIGLALCQRIIADHGGSIDFYSALGEGTTFTIRLPLPPSPLGVSSSEVSA